MESQEKNTKEIYDRQQKAYFLTANNPDKYGYTHDKITDIIHTKFKNVIYWCMCDEQGSCYHTHIYILLSKKKRWSSVANAFPHMHIENKVYGNPRECRAYIRKEGVKYQDKAETNFPDTFYEEGHIPDFKITENRTEMLLQIDDLLASGYRPEEIMLRSSAFRQYETIIRKQFFAKAFSETPPIREVTVKWHLGASGSGKSYAYILLCEHFGADNVYFASDYANNCTALLDGYSCEKYLFIDELKPDSMRYGYLLQLLQGYRTPIHARYANIFSLWSQIDITSMFTPFDIYNGMGISNKKIDDITQIMRRITSYEYHWKTDDGIYHTFEIPSSEFVSYDDLRRRAEGNPTSEFVEVTDDDEMPFD